MLIKILLIILILIIFSRIIDRYIRKELRIGEVMIWFVFWLSAGTLVVWPDVSQRLAELVGIGRGVDLVVYLAVILIFYLLFRIFVRFEKLERDITKIVRKQTLGEAEKEKKKL